MSPLWRLFFCNKKSRSYERLFILFEEKIMLLQELLLLQFLQLELLLLVLQQLV